MPRRKTEPTVPTEYPTTLNVEAKSDALGGKQIIAAITLYNNYSIQAEPTIYSAFRNPFQMFTALRRYIGPHTVVSIEIYPAG